ncbi:hypothetical protein LZ24_01930 [Desulfobotulus alkaliphilus]|uniref:Uncharacterized protein n=1 Tax=Desulfobotulus alkaliphilus TaxID=622671 RepID=A0A562RRD7_9BACT|nr:hypothetical protein [Desulfobotulus alkaliphilus]TWI71657.1 hypothetical protein LZ24_01930 [Desulfobotulus alkaliphilus]
MDLQELKEKFQSKAVADLKDINLVLKATPFLVREVIRLEESLAESERRVQHLAGMLRRSPPTHRTGKKDLAAWKIWLDERKNRLYIQLFGKVEKNSGKLISNAILSVMENLHPGFTVVVDLRKMISDLDSRARFYFRKTAYAFTQMQADPIVRVMEDSQSMRFLFEDMAKCPGPQSDADVHRVKTLEEADRLLDNLGRHLRS